MKLTEAMLNSMISRDPVAVAYTVSGNAVAVNGLLHRTDKERNRGEAEQSTGTVEVPRMRVMLMVSAVGENPPEEGVEVVVAGTHYRFGIIEISSDSTHYIAELTDLYA